MLTKRKYNVIFTTILQFFLIVNLVFLVFFVVSSNSNIIGKLYGFSIIIIYILLPISIIFAIIYLIKFKEKFVNIVVLIFSLIPISAIVLMLYVVADKLTQIP